MNLCEPSRRWFQMSLKTLFILMLVVAAYFAGVSTARREIRRVLDDLTNRTFKRPDGKIVAVNPDQNTVWIDMGRGDRLRVHIRFTVHESGDNWYRPTPKATIEVKRFLGESMAEAIIVQSDANKPIHNGDVLATPIWTPEEPEYYFLAGDFDINGDKKPDNELVHDLVRMSGGEIQTAMNIDTRYLLLGNGPVSTRGAEEYKKALKRAHQLHVKIFSPAEFLDHAGGPEFVSWASRMAP
jgi:hypothetical protein